MQTINSNSRMEKGKRWSLRAGGWMTGIALLWVSMVYMGHGWGTAATNAVVVMIMYILLAYGGGFALGYLTGHGGPAS